MTTTSLYVELIVIGFHVEIWLLLLVGCFQRGVFQTILKQADNAFVLIFALVPAYVFGMLFDRISDKIFMRKENSIRKKSGLQAKSNILIEETEKMHEFQLYTRSKYRIFRSTTLNIPLIVICTSLYLLINHISSIFVAIVILVLGALLTLLSLWCSLVTVRNFYNKAHFIEVEHLKL